MNEELSVRVIDRIASKMGADPANLHPPLYSVVDPTALDRLVGAAGKSSPVTVEFTYQGYRVTVDGDGALDVTAAPDTSTASSAARSSSPGP